MGLLDGKVAVITGAGNGIGRAEAMLFASEGARMVVNDLGSARDGTNGGASAADTVVSEIKAAEGETVASTDSVTNRAGTEAIMQRAIDAFGRIDILVNNASILRDKTLLKTTDEMWNAVIAVHLTGTFLCTQATARTMVAQNDGDRIVNTTSISGMLGNFGQTNYSAAKTGIYRITRTTAIELQKHRITVNALAPIAKTRLTEDLPMFQNVETLTPDHVAPAALFLASPLCEDKSGHVLAVSGSRMYVFKVVEGKGNFKDDNTPWSAQEISENWNAISKV